MKTCGVDGCPKPHRARGLCSTHYNQVNAKPVTVPCAACGEPVVKSNQRNTKQYRAVCSFLCRKYLQFGWPKSEVPRDHPARMPLACDIPYTHPVRSTRVPIWHPARRPASWRWPSCRVFYTDCSVCGRLFVTPYTTSTCSSDCADTKRRADRNEHKHRRRARKRAAFVAPVNRRQIYERDKWCCHLCGKKVHRTKVVPHPMAPVLDHVIPLAQGGTHEPTNVGTAHFLCNSIKGDGGGGDQLMLFG